MRFKKIALALSLVCLTPCLMNVSEPIEEETPTSITMEDLDNNGIPDVIEDYYNEHIRDQYAFGIGLGSILGVVSSIITAIVIIAKNSKSNRLLKENANNNSEYLKAIEEKIKEKDAIIEKQMEDNRALLLEISKLSDANLTAIKKASDKLENYSSFETKLNASLDCMKALGSSSENVKSGVGEKVNKIVGSVKK